MRVIIVLFVSFLHFRFDRRFTGECVHYFATNSILISMIGCKLPSAYLLSLSLPISTASTPWYSSFTGTHKNSLCGLSSRACSAPAPCLRVVAAVSFYFIWNERKKKNNLYSFLVLFFLLFSLFVSIYIVEIVKMCFLLPFIINCKMCAERARLFYTIPEVMRVFIHSAHIIIIYLFMKNFRSSHSKRWQRRFCESQYEKKSKNINRFSRTQTAVAFVPANADEDDGKGWEKKNAFASKWVDLCVRALRFYSAS